MTSVQPYGVVKPDQADLIAAMRAPGFFGYAQLAEVVETHSSWVFLTDDRAFKLKKAIVLPFLDYGTAGRRRAMCEEEVRLNRRLAPGIYLGVRSVIRTLDGYTLAAPDDPRALDYVVEMRRFHEADTLAAKLAAGTAKPAEIRAIGERLAEFHAGAARGGGEWPGDLVAALEDSLRDIESMGGPGERHCAAALRRFSRSFLSRGDRMLRARTAAVREGHGDLR
ncbi:MAG TPA: hypothetical protein VHM30_00765, partial [Gemmatimonadaceae bacterium]|nr:hypothetical protein [Gemmatimonadaceae bacterium]